MNSLNVFSVLDLLPQIEILFGVLLLKCEKICLLPNAFWLFYIIVIKLKVKKIIILEFYFRKRLFHDFL